MNMGTGKGSGMGTGTGKGALYILQGVGMLMGTGMGMMVGWMGASVWVEIDTVCGLQLTPLVTMKGLVWRPLFIIDGISGGSTVVSFITSFTV